MSGQAALQARGLHKAYGALCVTDQLDLDVHIGEIHALIGPNGAGKTTVINLLAGALKADAGTILLHGDDVSACAPAARARRGLGRTFQITSVFLDRSARENVALAVQAGLGRHYAFWRRAANDRLVSERAAAVLAQLGLHALAERPASALSHGEQKQLELAMALAAAPSVLLLDEPMAGVGPSERQAMAAQIARLRPAHAILLVEHDMDVVFSLADRVSVLVYGRCIASGAPAAVRADPDVQRAYLQDGAS